MPGYGLPRVKFEGHSESEDDDVSSYTNTQILLPRQYDGGKSEMAATSDPAILSLDKAEIPFEHNHLTANLLQHLQGPSTLEDLAPPAPAATPVREPPEPAAAAAATLATLHSAQVLDFKRSLAQGSSMDLSRHMLLDAADLNTEFMPLLPVKDEPLSEGEHPLSGSDTSDPASPRRSPKAWTPKDMDRALEALRTHRMSLTKASSTYGIPSTTLWQRAHRLGIDTPKKEGGAKAWGPSELRDALRDLRAGVLSANKASKAYGIPSSTLYKIARREGIRLAAPFNAAPTTWRRADLRRALDDVRQGGSVQRAAAAHGIPTGTLYGRCKREGIELSRSSPAPWSEDAMGEALEAVRVGQMSINQAAIHFNLPYSSLYGRFKRCKYQPQSPTAGHLQPSEHPEAAPLPSQNCPPDYPPPATSLQYYHPDYTQMSHSAEYNQDITYEYYNQGMPNAIVTS